MSLSDSLSVPRIFIAISLVYLIGLEFQLEAIFGEFLDFRFRTRKFSKIDRIEYENRDSSIEKENFDNWPNQRIAIVDGHGNDAAGTYLRHIREMFEHMGYKIITGNEITVDQKWDVMWYHEYSFNYEPFKTLIKKSSNQQIVNHVPGSGYYTSKVSLATCGLKSGVPKAFQLPDQQRDLLDYAEKHPDVLWVQKDNTHRNIRIRKMSEMDLAKNNSFVQKFIDNPLLIDNRKFDIGIYTVVTSILPLRVYIYTGDVLIRFCPEDYQPFDVNNVDKYVVGDDYTPIWEIKSLSNYVNNLGLSFKHSLDAYLGTKNLDSSTIWRQIADIIREVFQSQQASMLVALQNNQFKANYFELSRFDFVVDEDLNVFLMEANMSPNLSSGHFKQNQILYEKVLKNIFSLTGIGQQMTKESQNVIRNRTSSQNSIVNSKDINLPFKYCVEGKCNKCDEALECYLCGHCMSDQLRKVLENAYLEHLNRQEMRRIQLDFENQKPITKEDHLFAIWVQTKCQIDNSWCH